VLRGLQRQLEQFYALEDAPDIVEFVRTGAEDSRETLLLREEDGELEIAVVLPPQSDGDAAAAGASDLWLQLAEGVSHFVYLAERARTNLPATRLELELQAEVDKFVLLATEGGALPAARPRHFHVQNLQRWLYEHVRFLHPEGTEAGDRYRLANDLAARFVTRTFLRLGPNAAHRTLRRFYRSGQTGKIHLARAA
jgi:hypothetical protein